MRPRRSLLQILTSSLLGLPWRLWLCFPKSMRASVYIRLGRWYSVQEWSIQYLPFRLILKHTQDRSPEIEANNIKFVQENTTIPVPRILDVLPDVPKGNPSEGLILMTEVKGVTLVQWLFSRTTYPPEFIHYSDLIFGPAHLRGGRSLRELSELMASFDKPVLDLSDSAVLIADLKKTLIELRSIPPPPSGEVSGLHGSPFVHIRCGDRCLVQPLKNIRSFHDMLLANVSFVSRMPSLLQMASPVYAKPHKLCFSHCNLNHTNILVTEDGRLAAIIDWEAAGWFPEYWEYTSQVMQNMDSEILAEFWNAVGVFEKGCYEKELELERALWHGTGDTAVPPGIRPDDPLDIPLHEDKDVMW
ncbi:kinase-like protein [Armillaria novae-zelandiae]|uniref:Kinase-like protein n=1 Tax=Armillaria novae-zelandiae TaxID=153914 RepID=A0AA39PUJ8_9AGAR|nr:kinase-like protein [Armillaria novae-zelandiae]